MLDFKLHYHIKLIGLADDQMDVGVRDSRIWGLSSEVYAGALYQDGKKQVWE